MALSPVASVRIPQVKPIVPVVTSIRFLPGQGGLTTHKSGPITYSVLLITSIKAMFVQSMEEIARKEDFQYATLTCSADCKPEFGITLR